MVADSAQRLRSAGHQNLARTAFQQAFRHAFQVVFECMFHVNLFENSLCYGRSSGECFARPYSETRRSQLADWGSCDQRKPCTCRCARARSTEIALEKPYVRMNYIRVSIALA